MCTLSYVGQADCGISGSPLSSTFLSTCQGLQLRSLKQLCLAKLQNPMRLRQLKYNSSMKREGHQQLPVSGPGQQRSRTSGDHCHPVVICFCCFLSRIQLVLPGRRRLGQIRGRPRLPGLALGISFQDVAQDCRNSRRRPPFYKMVFACCRSLAFSHWRNFSSVKISSASSQGPRNHRRFLNPEF